MPELKLTKEMVARKFAEAGPAEVSGPPQASDQVWAYRMAAAVLSSFDLDGLKPYNPPATEDPGALDGLVADSSLVYDQENRPLWTLRADVRREALRRLGSRPELQKALEANPDRPRDPVQVALAAIVYDRLPPLEGQSLEQLVGTLQATQWLEGVLDRLPEQQEVQRRLEWARLIEPFRWLVGDDFCGRTRELERLREYVGVLPPSSFTKQVVRGVREVFNLDEKPPLVIHGDGGIGKSTLVAKFILEHVEGGEDSRFPFTYIDFDRLELTAQEPATLLIEAVRQLGIEYPQAAELAQTVRDHWLQELSRTGQEPWMQSSSYGPEQGMRSSLRDRSPLLADVSKVLEATGDQKQPFLLVLDTFEQVQSSRDYVAELWALLGEVQRRIPRLRTVISGRVPIPQYKTQDLELGDLDAEAAMCLLQKHGVSDPELVRRLVRQVGGHPHNLELAAEIIQKEGLGSAGIEDLGAWKRLWMRVRDKSVQGYLYRRLLDQIDDANVRKLARLGFVLRLITPELIQQVLAEPCGVEVKTKERARELFDTLAQEVALVQQVADGALRERPELRQTTLDGLQYDEPLKVLEVHERAAEYYGHQTGVANRAEEIYHRLFFEKQLAVVDKLWERGVEAYFEGALEEVPERARPYLASRLGVTAPGLIPDDPDLEVWERLAEQRTRALMGYGKWEDALKVLGEREKRTPGSPLYLLEAQALENLGRLADARLVAKSGLDSAAQADYPALLLDLLRLLARVDEKLGEWQEAREMLLEAQERAPEDDSLVRLDLTVSLLRLARLDPPADPGVVLALRKEAAALFDRAGAILSQVNLPLLRDVALEVGVAEPEVLRRALRAAPTGRLDPARQQALAEVLAGWDAAASRQEGGDPGVLARTVDLEVGADLAKTWSEFLVRIDAPYFSKVLDRLLGRFPVPEDVARRLVEILLGREDAPKSAL